jgi:hypothetical protein
MPVLRIGERSPLALLFNELLRSPALQLPADAGDLFGTVSTQGARQLQQRIRHELVQRGHTGFAKGFSVDGIPGNQTWGVLCAVLDPAVISPRRIAQAVGMAYPVRPAQLPPPPDTARMQALFGTIVAQPAHTAGNPERVRITNGWEQAHIVTAALPQTRGLAGSTPSGRHAMHRRVQAQMQGLWQAWEQRGLLSGIHTFSGLWVPRFQRGSTSVLSNHAWGTAFDVNASSNGYWHLPAFPGENGCLFEHAKVAADFGFGWGGHYARRLDGMHFEAVRVLSPGEVAQALASHTPGA